MECINRALNEEVAALQPKAIDQYSSRVIEGAQRALADNDNPLRLNFFSTAMRMLFEHIMDTLSPEDQVVKTSWFKPERPEGKATRWQRVMFAIQVGLSEIFVVAGDATRPKVPGSWITGFAIVPVATLP